ncbi:MAG TPA: methyltransferase domain-containing protein [Burkholderiales bacterium]|nr:methyltransferase domain-containing protein [Burkholderiales bacterium]
MEQVDPSAPCPVCGGALHAAGRRYSLHEILDLWDPIAFSERVVHEHRTQAPDTQLFECAQCGLGIFLPQIIGTPAFYDELVPAEHEPGGGSPYYEETKWDFEQGLSGVHEADSVLEFGCGPGHFLEMASVRAARVVGIEHSDTAIGLARARGIEVYKANAMPDALKGSFDAVFAFHVLEHVAAPMELLRSLLKSLKADGVLAVSVPNQDGPIRFMDPCAMNMPPHHATRWRFRTFELAAERLGLRIERVAYEPLLLTNHSYYSVYWVRCAFPGSGFLVTAMRSVLSWSLRAFFKALLLIGQRYFRPLRGQSIYVAFRRAV